MLCVAPPVCVPPGGEPGHRPVRRAEPVARPGEPPGSGRQREFLNIPERPGPGGQSAGSCQDNTRTGRGGSKLGDRTELSGDGAADYRQHCRLPRRAGSRFAGEYFHPDTSEFRRTDFRHGTTSKHGGAHISEFITHIITLYF